MEKRENPNKRRNSCYKAGRSDSRVTPKEFWKKNFRSEVPSLFDFV